jgi:hypothetical protein
MPSRKSVEKSIPITTRISVEAAEALGHVATIESSRRDTHVVASNIAAEFIIDGLKRLKEELPAIAAERLTRTEAAVMRLNELYPAE